MDSPISDYNPLNPAVSADATVYPPPSSSTFVTPASGEPPAKKRKRAGEPNGDAADVDAAGPGGAVYPQLVHTNEHVRNVQQRNRKEFEDMISLCVRIVASCMCNTPWLT